MSLRTMRSDHAELRGGRLASGSEARRLLRIVVTRESRKRACERPKARRAEVPSTRSEAQCAATEHRAAKSGTVRRCGTTMPNCGHAQRASAAPEHRAAVREAKGRLGPGNLEGEARKYAGPYPRAAKGECAGETGEGGAKVRNDHAELRVGAKRKNTFPPRLLAVEAREAVRRQAIGKSRPQTAGLWAIRSLPGSPQRPRAKVVCAPH